MKILGVSCYYHDSAASIIIDNEIVACCQEERFTRIKHTPEFPFESIKYCLEESGLKVSELDAIVFYDKPVLKFDRIISTFYEVSPKGILPFLKSIPIWLKEKLFLRTTIFNNLKEIDSTIKKKEVNILFSEHHLSHAASAFYPSNFNESAILTIDAVGEWSTSSISYGSDKSIKILKELNFPNSVGLLYSAFTYYLGFKVNSGEYKLMGLAPYGNRKSEETKVFIDKIKNNIVCIKDDGSISLDQTYFNYMSGLRMVNENNFKKLLNLNRRNMKDEISQVHCNLALAIQIVIEEIVIKMAKEAKRITNSNYLCLAGGVALNCVANGKIEDLGIFKRVYIQPAAGDAGGSLGAALIANHMYYNISRKYNKEYDLMKGSYLGPYYSDKEVILINKKFNAKYNYFKSFQELAETTASLIAKGNVIGWFQGRSEFGPRALGNRSILADPRNSEMQKRLNLKIKYRESFRPFAPSVLEEDFYEYFKSKDKNPYMLSVKKINDNIKNNVPKDYEELNYWDKLYTDRSKLQAITHVDFSSRIQSVSKNTNFKFWSLINEFKKNTGISVLINTSFNVRGEPIVNSPEDAINCFMNTEMDYLVINNFLYEKKAQNMIIEKTVFEKD
tara:strand:- start:310 stop:2163 length:1854 start_codon:yes stop_codon:yes gene_type:complete